MLKDLLLKFFSQLNNESIEYCVVGNYKGLPEYTENDVDIWVDDTDKAGEILLSLAKGIGLKLYILNKTANGTNNYFYVKTRNGIEIIKIDLMCETAYKSILPLVTSNLIKSNREKYKGFFVANDLIESVMHLLYPLVTFGEVKEKYKEKLYTFSKSPEYVELIESILGKKIGARIISEIQEENWVALQHEAGNVRKYLFKKTFLNISFFRLKIFINFFITIFYRTVGKNGIVISFTGIDGAGKTSIKEHLINNSDKYFTKNRKIEFYWRPFLLPRVAQVIGSKGQKETLDGSGKRVVNSGLISSFKNLMKYFYYAADFIFGQIKYFKEAHTGGLVIFDRYHFDNIIYPERFGFKVNRIIMRMFDKVFIPQPDRLFYFTADAQVLFDRKHEIDIDEINAQKKIYSTEMNFNKNVITIDTGCSFNDSINNVLLECLEFMSNRYNKHG